MALFESYDRRIDHINAVLKEYGIKEGNPADFIILDADSEFDAIRLCSEVIYTVRRGKIIAKVEPAKRTFHGDGEERQVDFKI